jgi:TfoX/Sxy family transcriptional regulator of competence genes
VTFGDGIRGVWHHGAMAWSTDNPTQERLDGFADAYLARPGVDWGRMFGTVGLRVRGKIFAVAVHTGGLMVKIPEARADARIAAGGVERMVMRGREMREWVVVPLDAPDAVWSSLLEEAYAYLDEITPRG